MRMNIVEINHFLGRLLLAPVFEASAAQALNYLRRPMEWVPVIKAASQNLITPALYTSFLSLKLFQDLPGDLQAYLTEIHRCNALRNREIKKEVLQLTSLFNQLGVEPIFLKGVANLFYDIYPDPADRMMQDADILVPPTSLPECIQILKKENYYSVGNESLFCEKSPHYLPLVADQRQAIIELHQYSALNRYNVLYTENDFWASSIAKTIGDVRFRLPSPINHIKLHLAHAHKHYGMYGTGHFFLRGFYDFAFLCKKFEDQLNWSRLEADFARSGFRKTLISYLLASDEFCGFKDPLQDVRIKKSERLFLHAVNIHLEYPSVFSLLKLMSSYKQVFLEILPDRRRRNEFLKKLKTLQFYARQIRHVRQSFLKQ